MDNLTITICLATTASHTLTTFNSTCLVKQSTENLDLMATKIIQHFMILSTYLRGKIQRTMVKGKETLETETTNSGNLMIVAQRQDL